MVKIGQASISENGGINGNAGDSTGKEVYMREWWDNNWTFVYRPKKSSVAKTLVKGMKLACKNDNIGYGQYDRITLFNELKRLAGNGNITTAHIKRIKKKVNCDCSSLVAALVYIAGYRTISPYMTTYNEYQQLMNTGGFKAITGVILSNPTLLKKGDIIQSTGHTVIVVAVDKTETNDSNVIVNVVRASGTALQYDADIAGKYAINVSPVSFLSLRDDASVNKKEIARLLYGMTVQCYGYHTNEWYYVVALIDNVQYIGFCNCGYLKRLVD